LTEVARILRNEIKIRKAEIEDLKAVLNVYERAIEVMNSNGIHQWDSIYPNEEIISQDILNNQMFLCEHGDEIASVVVLNQDYDKEYINGDWQYKEATFFIVHRLCVNPDFQGRGIGSTTMQYVEGYLRDKGIEAVRLDAYSLNPAALKLYEKLGYKKVGEVNWRKGLFYLYEKKLNGESKR
jgi:ribosomal protein S18 acetylase RimI-like enzyme